MKYRTFYEGSFDTFHDLLRRLVREIFAKIGKKWPDLDPFFGKTWPRKNLDHLT